MKSIWLTISLILVLLEFQVLGAIYNGYFKSANHPGKCAIDDKTILDKGQTITKDGCTRISCGSDSLAEFASCGVKSVGHPCYIGEIKYPNAEYPKCCINVIYCPDNEGEL